MSNSVNVNTPSFQMSSASLLRSEGLGFCVNDASHCQQWPNNTTAHLH